MLLAWGKNDFDLKVFASKRVNLLNRHLTFKIAFITTFNNVSLRRLVTKYFDIT